MADNIFEHPRLAAIYDALDADRSDLDVYVGITEELGARRVLDVGCGTGTFAILLAERGLEVTGVDPALASLEVARAKPGGDRVRWIHGDATSLPRMQVELATMTGNVAQAIVKRSDWEATLRGIYNAMRPGGLSSSRHATRHIERGKAGTARRLTALTRSTALVGSKAGTR